MIMSSLQHIGGLLADGLDNWCFYHHHAHKRYVVQILGSNPWVPKVIENEKVKCEQYWPLLDTNHGQSTLRFPPFTITNTKQTLESNGLYQLSRLTLAKTNYGELRKVDHYLFLGWPDFDVPKEPKGFLTFLDVINERLRQLMSNGPLIIHCSAGIGRTGTFTAIDICLAQAKNEGYVDVPGVVTRIRQQRACSVQLAKQYAFVYQALYTRLKGISQ
ncbi:hypothetical protein ACTXT7_005009 [Hymenolepis weldensis]